MGSPERRDLEPRREQAQRDTTKVAESRGSASGQVQGGSPGQVWAAAQPKIIYALATSCAVSAISSGNAMFSSCRDMLLKYRE